VKFVNFDMKNNFQRIGKLLLGLSTLFVKCCSPF